MVFPFCEDKDKTVKSSQAFFASNLIRNLSKFRNLIHIHNFSESTRKYKYIHNHVLLDIYRHKYPSSGRPRFQVGDFQSYNEKEIQKRSSRFQNGRFTADEKRDSFFDLEIPSSQRKADFDNDNKRSLINLSSQEKLRRDPHYYRPLPLPLKDALRYVETYGPSADVLRNFKRQLRQDSLGRGRMQKRSELQCKKNPTDKGELDDD